MADILSLSNYLAHFSARKHLIANYEECFKVVLKHYNWAPQNIRKLIKGWEMKDLLR